MPFPREGSSAASQSLIAGQLARPKAADSSHAPAGPEQAAPANTPEVRAPNIQHAQGLPDPAEAPEVLVDPAGAPVWARAPASAHRADVPALARDPADPADLLQAKRHARRERLHAAPADASSIRRPKKVR